MCIRDSSTIMHDQRDKIRHVIQVNSQSLKNIHNVRGAIPTKQDYMDMEVEVKFLKFKISRMKEKYDDMLKQFQKFATDLQQMDVTGNFTKLLNALRGTDKKIELIDDLLKRKDESNQKFMERLKEIVAIQQNSSEKIQQKLVKTSEILVEKTETIEKAAKNDFFFNALIVILIIVIVVIFLLLKNLRDVEKKHLP
eukprot:TRINITY_DN2587_c0_g1_i2.p3 TRINITY_DN2587_c0_g1~~TRINITY_DN2587_c0_g1_i2.p3  ORF type:complete len:196 (-),score=90.17 TRINITY_DN2587_c0_g1_i2:210-797(-)